MSGLARAAPRRSARRSAARWRSWQPVPCWRRAPRCPTRARWSRSGSGSSSRRPGRVLQPEAAPDRGERPADIVTGFLDAMTATPLNTKPAQEYLSTQAQSAVGPARASIDLRRTHAAARGVDRVVVAAAKEPTRSDARGQWQGATARPQRHRLVFPMVREDGEWRIARAPNALIVPKTFYDQHVPGRGDLYFFDPSGRILVPEPVHVPQGPAARLVAGAGPG